MHKNALFTVTAIAICLNKSKATIFAAAPNPDLRTREYLTPDEVERLMAAAKANHYSHRDATMVLVALRHGLRAAELVDLRWEQVDFETATLHVHRVKKVTPSVHPIREMSCGHCGGSTASRSLSRVQRHHSQQIGQAIAAPNVHIQIQ